MTSLAFTAGAVWSPADCVILALDPATRTGYALLRSRPEGIEWRASGSVRSIERLDFVRGLIQQAVGVADLEDAKLVVVHETWLAGNRRLTPATVAGMAAAWGVWNAELLRVGVPKRRIISCPMGRWSARILGRAALKTEERHRLSIAIAQARYRRPANAEDHDEAAALCIGTWAANAAEVHAVLPRRRRN